MSHDVHQLAERDLRASTRLPGQTDQDARRLLRDAWSFGLATGYIAPRAGDIGDPQREVTFEPLTEPVPEPAPATPQPDREPVPA